MKRFLILILASLAIPSVAFGAIQFDASSSLINCTASPCTWSHTVGGGSNTILIVPISAARSGTTVTSTAASYAGQAMTEAVHRNVSSFNEESIWYLINPPSGTNTVSTTFSANPSAADLGGISFTGVKQTSPVEATSSATGIGTVGSTTITTVSDNSFIVDVMGTVNNVAASSSASQTIVLNKNDGNFSSIQSSYAGPITPASSQTMSWGFSSSIQEANAAISIAPAATTAATTTSQLSISPGTAYVGAGTLQF